MEASMHGKTRPFLSLFAATAFLALPLIAAAQTQAPAPKGRHPGRSSAPPPKGAAPTATAEPAAASTPGIVGGGLIATPVGLIVDPVFGGGILHNTVLEMGETPGIIAPTWMNGGLAAFTM